MSFTDDRHAEIEAQLDRAWQKCLYGRKYGPAYELALHIKVLRSILKKKEEKDVDSELNCVERRYMLRTAGILLLAAITTSKKLREVADALDAEKSATGNQANILRAYEDCIQKSYPPTISELRQAIVKRFGEQCLATDFSIRKTLKVLRLPLGEGQIGRPASSRSIIHNRKH
jgi:hypothetical protein